MSSTNTTPQGTEEYVLDTLIDCISSFGDVHGTDARAAAEYILSASSGLTVTLAVTEADLRTALRDALVRVHEITEEIEAVRAENIDLRSQREDLLVQVDKLEARVEMLENTDG